MSNDKTGISLWEQKLAEIKKVKDELNLVKGKTMTHLKGIIQGKMLRRNPTREGEANLNPLPFFKGKIAIQEQGGEYDIWWIPVYALKNIRERPLITLDSKQKKTYTSVLFVYNGIEFILDDFDIVNFFMELSLAEGIDG
jgi:hypothetical protein